MSQNTTNYNNVYRFSAKELDDETQLSYFGARYYDARLSYWLSVDPLWEKTPNWTPYRYCFNNPLKFTDPTGMYEGDVDDWIEYETSDGKQSITYDAEIKTKEQAEAKGYKNVKQVFSSANVTNNTNGDKIYLNSDGSYAVNGGCNLNLVDNPYKTENGSSININQNITSQIAPVLQDVGDGMQLVGTAMVLSGVGAPIGASLIVIGGGLSTAGTALELIDDYSKGSLTGEKLVTKAAMELIPAGGHKVFKYFQVPEAAEAVNSATIGADILLDEMRSTNTGPYRN